MPFTIAHPAIVMPLRKTRLRLSMTGLIAGSIAPDLEFFIQMREVDNIGHHWYGIFIFDLPVALILMFLFHNLIRNSFVSNLPALYRKRLLFLKDIDWNHYAINNKFKILVSILIGVASHLLWDSFTHHDGFIVDHISIFSSDIKFIGFNLPVYFLLQLIFSLLGLYAVHIQLLKMSPAEETVEHKINSGYWGIFFLIFSIIISLRLTIWPELNSFGGIAIAIMGSIFYSWIPVSIIFKEN